MTHAVSTAPPSVFPPISQQHESDSTQLYQKVPADLLRKARESRLSSAPPPAPRAHVAPSSQTREDPWATADERTAVFAPPPELLASVRAAAASAGLIPNDGPVSEPAPSGRITAEFDVAGETGTPASSEASESTDAAPSLESEATEREATGAPLATSTREESTSGVEADENAEVAERRRWPWAVAALLIAAALAGLAVRSHMHPTSKPGVAAPSR